MPDNKALGLLFNISSAQCMRVGLKVSVGQPDMHLVLEFGQISAAAFNGRLSSRYSCCNWSALTPSFGTKTWKWLTSFHILLQNQLHRVPCHSMTEGRPTEKNVSICALPKSDTFFWWGLPEYYLLKYTINPSNPRDQWPLTHVMLRKI